MADVEDAEFGSHFLDSMLEVEMTEEDNVLDVSKNDDPFDTLPPIPTFDLQSETISYKDVYRNTVPQPVLASFPLAASNASNIPLVLKPSSMLIYSGEVPSPKPAPVLTSVQRIPPKPNPKPPVKTPSAAPAMNITSKMPETPTSKFLKEVFRPEFVKHVFVKADPPWDISRVSGAEMKYYRTCFKDVSKIQNCRLHCTICDKHLGCAVSVERRVHVHNMLKVLTCKPCFEFYGDGNFPCDTGDNCEIYCRWCGQGGALVCCSFCPSVFCKRCVKRNYGLMFLRSVEKARDWACFCCAQKPLWPHRAICRALLEFIGRKKTDPKIPDGDTTSCCTEPTTAATLTRKRLRTSTEKRTPPPQPQTSQVKVGPASRSSDGRSKTLSPLVPGKREQLLLKPIVQLKATDRVKIPLNPNGNSRPMTNIFSPRSILGGSSVIRGIATTAPGKLFSAIPAPQLIQSPVIHGETLITPPSRFLVKPPTSPPNSTPFVRVSLTHQAPNLDVNKMPTVKIPHEVHGLVLRLIFPDNKMHYVRLTSDGSGCKSSKDFPMPQFKEGACFVEENLAEAFKVSKTTYDKLLRIKEKVSSRTKFTEESVFNSSVKKLHLAYEKTIELLKGLDKSLMENHEQWKNEAKTAVDVIDISDDETSASKKSKPGRYFSFREKCKKVSYDSDIEILDDVIVNGKPPPNSRLRTPTTPGTGRKRRRGRHKRNNKRLKTARIGNATLQNGQPEEDPLKIDPDEAEAAQNEPASCELADNSFDAQEEPRVKDENPGGEVCESRGEEEENDVGDAGAEDAAEAGDATDAVDTADAEDGADAEDPVDGEDGADAEDAMDGEDGADAEDAMDGEDGADAEDAMDGEDGADGADVDDAVDAEDGADAEDAEDTVDAEDAEDTVDAEDAVDTVDADEAEDADDAEEAEEAEDAEDGEEAEDAEEAGDEEDAEDAEDSVDADDAEDPKESTPTKSNSEGELASEEAESSNPGESNS